MQKILIYFILIVFVFACKKKTSNQLDTGSKTDAISFNNVPNINDFNQETTVILNSWVEFEALQNSFDLMYRADNNEDLTLAIDEILVKEELLRASIYPEPFNKPQIKSRQKVMRNFLLKIKANLIDQVSVDEALKQMVISRNAFRNQFNIIINTKLDPELILEEN